MAIYQYEGQTKAGEKVTGQINAKNDKDLRIQLRKMGIRPKRIKKPGIAELDLMALLTGGGGSGKAGRMKEKDLAMFTRQFSTMVNSGVPILQALEIQATQSKDPGIKKLLEQIKEKVSTGSTFYSALAEHKTSFDNLYINMIKAGEAGGILDLILERLSSYLEKAVKLKGMVKGAMMYPAIIMLVGIGVVTALLVFVIPKFQSMLEGAGQELPVPTKIVIGASNWLQENIIWAMPVFVAFCIFLSKFKKHPTGKPIFDRLLLKAPIFGDLAMKSAVARFARTLGTLLSSGVSLMEALTIAQAVLDNVIFERAVIDLKKGVEEGKSLSEPLMKSKVFPDLAIQMINVGESTGEIDTMLGKVADYYEDEVETLVGNLSKLIEPIVLVVLGGLVGGILIAMYLPIFKLAGSA